MLKKIRNIIHLLLLCVFALFFIGCSDTDSYKEYNMISSEETVSSDMIIEDNEDDNIVYEDESFIISEGEDDNSDTISELDKEDTLIEENATDTLIDNNDILIVIKLDYPPFSEYTLNDDEDEYLLGMIEELDLSEENETIPPCGEWVSVYITMGNETYAYSIVDSYIGYNWKMYDVGSGADKLREYLTQLVEDNFWITI